MDDNYVSMYTFGALKGYPLTKIILIGKFYYGGAMCATFTVMAPLNIRRLAGPGSPGSYMDSTTGLKFGYAYKNWTAYYLMNCVYYP